MTWSWSPAPVLIAGPCALEGDAVNLAIGERLAELEAQLGLRVLYKGSFDKANRSGIDAPRGPGLEAGLRQLETVRAETGLPVLTDVHASDQMAQVAAVVDAVQIPAFLCRQTDLLVAAGRTGKPVNIKKGQWMGPAEVAGAVEKVRRGGSSEIAVTERGTFFGYGDLVVDMRNFELIKGASSAPVLFDGTHAVQRAGLGPGGGSAGTPEHIEALVCAAAAAGADGFFLETHPDPTNAPSDSATMLRLEDLEDVMVNALDIWNTRRARVTAQH